MLISPQTNHLSVDVANTEASKVHHSNILHAPVEKNVDEMLNRHANFGFDNGSSSTNSETCTIITSQCIPDEPVNNFVVFNTALEFDAADDDDTASTADDLEIIEREKQFLSKSLNYTNALATMINTIDTMLSTLHNFESDKLEDIITKPKLASTAAARPKGPTSFFAGSPNLQSRLQKYYSTISVKPTADYSAFQQQQHSAVEHESPNYTLRGLARRLDGMWSRKVEKIQQLESKLSHLRVEKFHRSRAQTLRNNSQLDRVAVLLENTDQQQQQQQCLEIQSVTEELNNIRKLSENHKVFTDVEPDVDSRYIYEVCCRLRAHLADGGRYSADQLRRILISYRALLGVWKSRSFDETTTAFSDADEGGDRRKKMFEAAELLYKNDGLMWDKIAERLVGRRCEGWVFFHEFMLYRSALDRQSNRGKRRQSSIAVSVNDNHDTVLTPRPALMMMPTTSSSYNQARQDLQFYAILLLTTHNRYAAQFVTTVANTTANSSALSNWNSVKQRYARCLKPNAWGSNVWTVEEDRLVLRDGGRTVINEDNDESDDADDENQRVNRHSRLLQHWWRYSQNHSAAMPPSSAPLPSPPVTRSERSLLESHLLFKSHAEVEKRFKYLSYLEEYKKANRGRIRYRFPRPKATAMILKRIRPRIHCLLQLIEFIEEFFAQHPYASVFQLFDARKFLELTSEWHCDSELYENAPNVCVPPKRATGRPPKNARISSDNYGNVVQQLKSITAVGAANTQLPLIPDQEQQKRPTTTTSAATTTNKRYAPCTSGKRRRRQLTRQRLHGAKLLKEQQVTAAVKEVVKKPSTMAAEDLA